MEEALFLGLQSSEFSCSSSRLCMATCEGSISDCGGTVGDSNSWKRRRSSAAGVGQFLPRSHDQSPSLEEICNTTSITSLLTDMTKNNITDTSCQSLQHASSESCLISSVVQHGSHEPCVILSQSLDAESCEELPKLFQSEDNHHQVNGNDQYPAERRMVPISMPDTVRNKTTIGQTISFANIFDCTTNTCNYSKSDHSDGQYEGRSIETIFKEKMNYKNEMYKKYFFNETIGKDPSDVTLVAPTTHSKQYNLLSREICRNEVNLSSSNRPKKETIGPTFYSQNALITDVADGLPVSSDSLFKFHKKNKSKNLSSPRELLLSSSPYGDDFLSSRALPGTRVLLTSASNTPDSEYSGSSYTNPGCESEPSHGSCASCWGSPTPPVSLPRQIGNCRCSPPCPTVGTCKAKRHPFGEALIDAVIVFIEAYKQRKGNEKASQLNIFNVSITEPMMHLITALLVPSIDEVVNQCIEKCFDNLSIASYIRAARIALLESSIFNDSIDADNKINSGTKVCLNLKKIAQKNVAAELTDSNYDHCDNRAVKSNLIHPFVSGSIDNSAPHSELRRDKNKDISLDSGNLNLDVLLPDSISNTKRTVTQRDETIGQPAADAVAHALDSSHPSDDARQGTNSSESMAPGQTAEKAPMSSTVMEGSTAFAVGDTSQFYSPDTSSESAIVEMLREHLLKSLPGEQEPDI